ncbi:hypothetical protein V2A85_14700 [Yersinia sp. 1252 StPb PI]|uniref:hypothetical protein n=1 Tax=Yersinia sp. 1252 StPb PI TaxID=3117404 RepID=UPI003B283280
MLALPNTNNADTIQSTHSFREDFKSGIETNKTINIPLGFFAIALVKISNENHPQQ